MNRITLILALTLSIISCNKPTDDPMPATQTNQPILYFLEYEVPANTTVTSLFDGETVVYDAKSGPYNTFATIDKARTISYSATSPITIRVRERILNNYTGHIYLTITNTTSGTLDLSSLPE